MRAQTWMEMPAPIRSGQPTFAQRVAASMAPAQVTEAELAHGSRF